jgi:hypothetical protein
VKLHNKSLFNSLFIAILLLSTQALAQMKTPFETMREAFSDATTPATIHDFEYGKWKNCIFSDIANPMATRNTQVRTLQYPSSGNGPLFPGDNDYRVDVFSDYSLDNNLFSFFQNSWIKETDTVFKQTLDGPPWRHLNTYGRLDRDMLLFYVENSDYYGPQAPMYPRVYGYCWNEVSDDNGEQPLPRPK